MQKFMETIIYAIKSWMTHDFLTADDAFELMTEMNILEPLTDASGSVYTTPDGVIYTF